MELQVFYSEDKQTGSGRTPEEGLQCGKNKTQIWEATSALAQVTGVGKKRKQRPLIFVQLRGQDKRQGL